MRHRVIGHHAVTRVLVIFAAGCCSPWRRARLAPASIPTTSPSASKKAPSCSAGKSPANSVTAN